MAELDGLVKQAVADFKAGRKDAAREKLMTVVGQNERHEQAWLWLSAMVDSLDEQEVCLENVLAINPNNERAKKGLETVRSKRAAQGDSPPPAPPAPSPSPSPEPAPSPSEPDNPFGDVSFAWDSGPAESSGEGASAGAEVSPFGDVTFGDWDSAETASESAAETGTSDPFGSASSVDWDSGGSSPFHGSGGDAPLPTSEQYDEWMSQLNLGGADESVAADTPPDDSFLTGDSAGPFADTSFLADDFGAADDSAGAGTGDSVLGADSDPFGSGTDDSAFGDDSDPFGSTTDLFGAGPGDVFGDDSDPFGVSSGDSTFGTETEDAFGVDSDPFGSDADPFGVSDSDGGFGTTEDGSLEFGSDADDSPFDTGGAFGTDDLYAADDPEPDSAFESSFEFGAETAIDDPFGAVDDGGGDDDLVFNFDEDDDDLDDDVGWLDDEFEQVAAAPSPATSSARAPSAAALAAYFQQIPGEIEPKAGGGLSRNLMLVSVVVLLALNLLSFGYLLMG